MISVIIPTYNEEKRLGRLLRQIKGCDVIVVDGGSTDGTVRLAKSLGARVFKGKGRARQQRIGGTKAKGDVLLFLHADSRLPRGWKKKITGAILDGVQWGAFHIRFSSDALFYRLVEFRSNLLRARLCKVPFGDQGIFVKKTLYAHVGGMPAIPILEDVILSKKLRRVGRFRLLDSCIVTSPRKFEKYGRLKTYFAMGGVMLFYHLGFAYGTIKKLYARLLA